MSPVRLEAVYERYARDPNGNPRSAVRWGVRATFGGSETEPEAPRQGHRRPGAPAGGKPRPGGPRGPRELPPLPAERVLSYRPGGVTVPLPQPGSGAAHLGAHLDRLA
ncbi:MAG: hypothetical protein Q9Q40_04710 [Acidobacteriota bacterium]|nr:hypothetical protein [Acidobacteriota bacterium]MDQ7088829.1 hypothetical protein [Acidobacteriota bacterium]